MSLRNGAGYLAGLRDGRDVWLQGRKVEDVTTDPELAPFAHAFAGIFDLQHDPAHRELLTATSPTTDEPVSRAYQLPRTTSDLVRQREMFEFLDRLINTSHQILMDGPSYRPRKRPRPVEQTAS